MIKNWLRRRKSGGNGEHRDQDDDNACAVSRSSRTGGFEIQHNASMICDDDSIADSSMYTTPSGYAYNFSNIHPHAADAGSVLTSPSKASYAGIEATLEQYRTQQRQRPSYTPTKYATTTSASSPAAEEATKTTDSSNVDYASIACSTLEDLYSCGGDTTSCSTPKQAPVASWSLHDIHNHPLLNSKQKTETPQRSKSIMPPLEATSPISTSSSASSMATAAIPAVDLVEGLRPTITMQDRQEQLSNVPRYRLFPSEQHSLPSSSSPSSSNHSRLLGSIAYDADDDDASDSSTTLEVLEEVNISDSQLMEDAECSGTLRLTKEGLERHDRRTVQITAAPPTDDLFEEWQRQKQQRQFYRTKHEERDELLLDKALRISSSKNNNQQQHRKKQQAGRHALPLLQASATTKREAKRTEVAEVSLAPLNAMEHVVQHVLPTASPTDAQNTTSPKKKIMPWSIFFPHKKKKPLRSKANELLERERQRQREATREREIAMKHERARIARLRKAELERQRQLNAVGGSPQDQSAIIFEEFSTEAEAATPCKKQRPLTPQTRSETPVSESTRNGSGSSSGVLCAVCLQAERTHIAMPCMHYMFCDTCADMLRNGSQTCPICCTRNVVFSRVLSS